MTRRQKRRLRIAQNPRNVRFEDLRRLLEDYGFELRRTKGSHHSFVGYMGDEKVTLVIPFRLPLQKVYVEKVLAILNEIEPLDSDESEEGEGDDDEQAT
ncbi:MAG: type II toxin-antitoxin system HicA family toxin [Anaerolineae bacterium]|nr:type II toxin-antitoxin system HicA family toxin [Anaerolineae bacterium]